MKKRVEILAPAGSYESFQAAVAAGADAVYAGGSSFGARAFADNFTEEQLLDAIDYAHLHGRKLYLTVNTLLKDDEIKNELYHYLLPFYRQGLDAVIVQDVGVLEFITRYFPNLGIHASTQMTITNTLGAEFLMNRGVERVVPARELSLSEIHDMAERTGMEIECFVHGALCYCYSGQCLLSSLIGGRSGNRGQCAQPCRLPYDFNGRQSYLLSLKDICTLDLIPELIEAGIYSFKIEGRMKKPEYVAAVTGMYRKYVDLFLMNGKKNFHVELYDKENLMDIYNRGGFDDGYYKKHNASEMITRNRPNHAGVPTFQVISHKGREITGKALVPIGRGDILEFAANKENYTFGKPLKKGETFTLIGPKKTSYQQGTIFPRTRNQLLLDSIREQYINVKIHEKITGSLTLAAGENAVLELQSNGCQVSCVGDRIEEAQNQPLDKARISKQMRKTGNTEFEFEDLKIQITGNIFLPMQKLNELRRDGLEKLKKAICYVYRRDIPSYLPEIPETENRSDQITGFSVTVETMEQLNVAAKFEEVQRIYIDCNILPHVLQRSKELTDLIQHIKKCSKEVYFAMPHIFRQEAVKEYTAMYQALYELAADGILIRNYESFWFLKNHGFDKSIILDHNLYVFNQYAKLFWKQEGISLTSAPIELNNAELKILSLETSELIVYGYLPVMISAGCIQNTTCGCNHGYGIQTIKDRYKKEFKVKNYCDFCYNIIYNSAPLVLTDQADEIRALHPAGIRLHFSLEDADTTREILEMYRDSLLWNKDVKKPEYEFTRGHFRRGIK